MTVTVASHMQIDEYCTGAKVAAGNYTHFTVNLARYFLNYVDEYESATYELPHTYMCSTLCPCDGNSINLNLYPNGFGKEESLVRTNGNYKKFKDCYDDLYNANKTEVIIQ